VNIGTLVRTARWYLREISGESLYDRYLQHHAAEHNGQPPMTRAEFERWRVDRADAAPNPRCC
jgi:uncharacterized short protein YbdD (DUF466 family)